jgi:hypothetical protein
MRRLAILDGLSVAVLLLFIATFAIATGAILSPPAMAMGKSPIGCCTFDGQQQPLTQLQCSQYTMSSWNGNDPTCSN